MSELQDVRGIAPAEPSAREFLPILAGVVVSLVYVVSIAVVVVGLLRFTREYLRRLPTEPPPLKEMLTRLPFRR